MTTPDDLFLAAIRADWLDRTARLAYADWLEDRSDPRAELVRVCEGMRAEPVWSDRYWELKIRRNELWTRVPLEWLEATGYDGSYYDPIFRDGVPNGPRERWRLIREFTERWHGVAVADVGGQQDVIRSHERRLNVTLPPSVRELVTLSQDLGNASWSHGRPAVPLFHCAAVNLKYLDPHPALSLIGFSLDGRSLGVFLDDLESPDPPASTFSEAWSHDVDYDEDGQPTPRVEEPQFCAPSVTSAVFGALLTELPTAGSMSTAAGSPDALLKQLAVDFPIHAHFDGTDVFESNEFLVVVGCPHRWSTGESVRDMKALVRRPIPVAAIPDYLFGGDKQNTSSSGLLSPTWFRRQQEGGSRRPGWRPPSGWTSVLRREHEQAREAERPASAAPPPSASADWRNYEDGDEIPF